jgi:exopolyphosphatase / guanosine-5'-triphosphate,3'-diphosphate pyrophosphatase
MKNIGIIDIGSNSIRLIIVETYEDNSYKIVGQMKEPVRLGMDVTPDGGLCPIRMERAIMALSKFKVLYSAFNECEIYAIATEAVRKASNQMEFLRFIKEVLDIDVRVLTGIEEAYYDYIAVISSIDIQNALIMDIGGSSTEMILINNRNIINSISLPFGAITITNKFMLTEEMGIETEKELNQYLKLQFDKIPWLLASENLPLIGVGGTFRSIGEISKKINNFYIDTSPNYLMEAKDVLNIYNSTKKKNLDQRKKIKGLSKDRADIFLGAYSIISTIINFCRISEVIVSSYGVRHGLIHEIIHSRD